MGPASTPTRVALADDSYLIREAVVQVLSAVDGVEVVASCSDGDALWEAVERENPDVVITDIRMPPGGVDEGLRIAGRLRRSYPGIGVILLSGYAEPHFGAELLAGGADGRAYLLKDRLYDREQLSSAIHVVAHGGSMIDPVIVAMLFGVQRRRSDSPLGELTEREREVLIEMTQGKSNAAIAESLVLTKGAVEKHVSAIFLKLGLDDDPAVSRRVAAVGLYLVAQGCALVSARPTPPPE